MYSKVLVNSFKNIRERGDSGVIVVKIYYRNVWKCYNEVFLVCMINRY